MSASPPVPASQERVRDSSHPQSPVPGEVCVSATPSIYRLVVQPLVKGFVGERDSSGNALEPFVASGITFQEILEKIWGHFSSHVKGRAVRGATSWSMEMEDVAVTSWVKFMSFKVKKHIVDSSKLDDGWNSWLQLMQDKTATLIIYEYGSGLGRKPDRTAFMADCVRPTEVDRAGATAEVSLREVVGPLKSHREGTYAGEAVVWRMWANEVTRNLDRTTWGDLITAPPPPRILRLLNSSDSRMETRVANLDHSVKLALTCVNASIAEVGILRRDWDAFGRRLDDYERGLHSRKTMVEAFLRDINVSGVIELNDPMENIENTNDLEHQKCSSCSVTKQLMIVFVWHRRRLNFADILIQHIFARHILDSCPRGSFAEPCKTTTKYLVVLPIVYQTYPG